MPDWKTYDAWEIDKDLDPFEIDGVRLVMVCRAFPEAYDAFLDGALIGYLKMRYGHFFAKYPDADGEVVYDVHPGDSYGMFTPEERVEHLPKAVAALKKEAPGAGMTTSKNITPVKFRCGLGTCPSIHETENGDIVFVGPYVSHGELKNMDITYGTGESAVRFSRDFIDAYLLEHLSRKIAGK